MKNLGSEFSSFEYSYARYIPTNGLAITNMVSTIVFTKNANTIAIDDTTKVESAKMYEIIIPSRILPIW